MKAKLLGGAIAAAVVSISSFASAQAPIRIGEVNSYKAFAAFLEP